MTLAASDLDGNCRPVAVTQSLSAAADLTDPLIKSKESSSLARSGSQSRPPRCTIMRLSCEFLELPQCDMMIERQLRHLLYVLYADI